MTRQLPLGIALLALLLAATPALGQQGRSRGPADPARPDRIFHDYCSVCHGEKGDGKSLARFALDPPPADFTSPKTREKLSRAHMIETVKKGARTKENKPTAMVAWTSQLNGKQIEAVVDYVIVKFMGGKAAADEAVQEEGHRHAGHDHSAMKPVDYPYGLKPNAARGKALYVERCASCHGENGDGKGDPAAMGKGKPRDFRAPDFREFANGFSLYSAVSHGSGHTPTWDKTMSRQHVADVSEYLLRAFVKAKRAAASAK